MHEEEFIVIDDVDDIGISDIDSLSEFDIPIDDILEESNIEQVIQKTKKKKVTRNYINNVDFCEALFKYKEDCADAIEKGIKKPRIPNYIGECFLKIAEGLSRKPNFYGYSYKDEMIADGVENCLMYFENFDPSRKNPFAYFTQILFYCFIRRIQKEKKQQYIKYKATENFGILDESELMELGGGQIKQLEVYENMYDFIEKFEESEFKKSSKVANKKRPAGLELFLGD